MMKQWLMRRAVRMPPSLRDHGAHQLVGVQAALHQRLGLARAERVRTAFAAELTLCSASTSSNDEMSSFSRSATSRMRASGPTRIGCDEAQARGLDGAFQRDLVAGMRDGDADARQLLRSCDQPLVFLMASRPSALFGRRQAWALSCCRADLSDIRAEQRFDARQAAFGFVGAASPRAVERRDCSDIERRLALLARSSAKQRSASVANRALLIELAPAGIAP